MNFGALFASAGSRTVSPKAMTTRGATP